MPSELCRDAVLGVAGLVLCIGVRASAQNANGRPDAVALFERDTTAWCIPSPMSASRFDSVRIVAAVVPFDTSYRYTWSAAAGTVTGTGPAVWWRPTGAALGVESINVRATLNDHLVAECSARVAIIPPIRRDSARGASDLAARALLLPGAQEDSGYARYTYVLFASKPSAQNLARYRAVLREYVRQTETTTNYAAAFGKDSAAVKRLHVTYAPVQVPVADSESDSLAVESMLLSYDYARARVILSRLPGGHARGPYLVSGRRPLTSRTSNASIYLIQELATVPEDLVAIVLAQFLSDAAQDRPSSAWDPQRWSVRLQTALAIVAEAAKPVAGGINFWRDAVQKWISVK
ncbi:MAG: hypothetical protein JWM95_2641 [Gemmatimonadetes bacterium]|nr:hypothetical protein [Gemmatimonadota bacterium]